MKSSSRLTARMTLLVLMLSLLAPLSSAFAQSSTTRVYGTVKDPAGAIIPGAKVTLIDNASGKELKTINADEDGTFVFADVSPGSYKITAEQTGFKRLEVPDVKVDAGIPAQVTLELQAGDLSETVTVTASDAQVVIHTENAELSNVVSKRQIVDLPLNGRNPVQLANLQAGVSGNTGNRTAAINGQRGTFSNLTWDGIHVEDPFVRTDSLFAQAAPNVEGVAEFTLVTQNSGPDAGVGVAQLKLVTPRGTNEYHGSLFEFHRNDVMDANSFFNNASGVERAKLIRNQFGYNVGGPVPLTKRKLFFYNWLEVVRERSDLTTLRTVLSSQARQGIFRYVAATAVPSRGINVGDTVTVNLLQLTGRSIDPVIARTIGLTPESNTIDAGDRLNTLGFRFNNPNPTNSHIYGFRFDFDASDKHRFEAIYDRFVFEFPNDTFNDIGSVFPGLIGGGQESQRPRGSFAWHWNPTATITNEFRGGFSGSNPVFFNRETFEDGYRLALPLITNPIQTFMPQGRISRNRDFLDNATWAKGSHLIRFGGNFRKVMTDNFNDVGIVPQYTIGFNTSGNVNPLNRTTQFPGISTNDFATAGSLLALLTGAVGSATQTFNAADRESGFVGGQTRFREIDYKTLGFYGSDSWRWKPNFTVNYGMRWDYISVPTEKNGLALFPVDLTTEGLLNPNAAFDFAGEGTGRKFFGEDYNNFAPNISFAWDPFKDGKSSVRAGYSISYVIDNNITMVQNAFNTNTGLAATATISNTSGTVSSGGIVTVPTPAFKVPRTLVDNIAISQTASLEAIDPNIATPYVQQWTLSLEREIMRDTALEVRYVGNRGTKLTRAVDLNQITINENGFLQDFLRAQQNLALARARAATVPNTPISGAFNPNIPGSQQLTVFPRLGAGGLLNNATVIGFLDTNEVAGLVNLYLGNRNILLTPGVNGATVNASIFTPNPNANQVLLVGNSSWSTYNGLQVELRRRMRNGLYVQANYTFSKSLTDFEGSQSNVQSFLDNRAGWVLEKKRANFDVTHVFKANFIYELPFGKDRQWLTSGGVLDHIFGGWQLGGLLERRSGRPISIISGRSTFNRVGTNTVNTSLSVDEIKNYIGVFRDAQGRVTLFAPAIIGSDGRAKSEYFQNPGAGEIGELALTPFSGPGFFNMDANLMKNFRITERVGFQLRLEAFNVFNNVNFFVGETQNINSTTFGRITSTFAPRIMQISGKVTF